MKKIKQRMVSFLLMCLMVMSSFCLPAFAAGTSEFDPAGNLIRNPGFEDGLTNWTKGTGSMDSTQVMKSGAHSGTSTLYVGGFSSAVYSIQQSVALALTGQYELVAYIKLPSNANARTVTASIAAQSVKITQASDTWQKITIPFLAKQTGTQTARFEINGAGYFLLDDVSLVRKGDLPTLLVNPGFENGLTGWNNRGTSNAMSNSNQVRSGAKSIYMGYFASEGLTNYIDQTYASSNTGTYTFSAYIKTESALSGVGAALFIEAKDSAGNVINAAASSALSNSNGSWQKLTVNLLAPKGTQSITVKIGGLYCIGGFYVDDTRLDFNA